MSTNLCHVAGLFDKPKVLPAHWKTSIVLPIPKVDGTRNAHEFRPVNILPIYEKILEIVIKEQLDKHLEKHNIMVQEQSGFRKSHSCETSLQNLISSWKESIDIGCAVGVVFIDFKRAFETINRPRLLEKLKMYGLNGTVIKWFQSYLTERFQKTKYGCEVSGEKETKFGVPQGSVLGPTLFSLYINDIKSAVKDCSINLFADDTLLYDSGKDIKVIENNLNKNLQMIDKWMSINSLKSNSSKSKCMLIKNVRSNINQNLNINMSGERLEQVVEMKYLGVIVDNKLNFKAHAQYICKKVAKKINFLSRISNDISMFARITIYKSIISPHFEYCGSILYFLNQTNMQVLQKLQNRAMRVILKCNRYTPIQNMLQTLQFMSVKQRICYNTLIFIFKIREGLLPKYLQDRITYISERHDHSTRQQNDFYIHFRQKSFAQNYLFFKGLIMFNALPNKVKQIKNLNSFKREISTYVKIRY